MALESSELIFNEDGSIYHLNLRPEQLADTIITVGDPERVDQVTAFFDEIELTVRNREFHTQTGWFNGKRLSVISTGIGTDNIDIVFNELDALVNIDLENREIKDQLTNLTIVRIGTSGALHKDIPVDSFLASEAALGFDSLWHYYEHPKDTHTEVLTALEKQLKLSPHKSTPFFVQANPGLFEAFMNPEIYRGITATNIGFYAPQGRTLRAQPQDMGLVDKIAAFDFKGQRITNMEMETSGIYGMSRILGHRALSMNAIIANRATGAFSKDPTPVIKSLIQYVLRKLTG